MSGRTIMAPALLGANARPRPALTSPVVHHLRDEVQLSKAGPPCPSLATFRGTLGHVAMTFTRITTRPDVCTGKPCIRDLRFPVSRLLGLLASGQSREDILRAYPYLEAADIDEALRYAASLAEDELIELTG